MHLSMTVTVWFEIHVRVVNWDNIVNFKFIHQITSMREWAVLYYKSKATEFLLMHALLCGNAQPKLQEFVPNGCSQSTLASNWKRKFDIHSFHLMNVNTHARSECKCKNHACLLVYLHLGFPSWMYGFSIVLFLIGVNRSQSRNIINS